MKQFDCNLSVQRESKWCVKRLKCQSEPGKSVWQKLSAERIGYMKGLIKRGWIIKINLNRRTRENFTLLFARDKGPIKYGDNKNYYGDVCHEIIVIMLYLLADWLFILNYILIQRYKLFYVFRIWSLAIFMVEQCRRSREKFMSLNIILF